MILDCRPPIGILLDNFCNASQLEPEEKHILLIIRAFFGFLGLFVFSLFRIDGEKLHRDRAFASKQN
jgi:hypothetical protein